MLRQKLKIETLFDETNLEDEKDNLNLESNDELEKKNQQATKKTRLGKSTRIDRKSVPKSDEFLCFFCEKRFDKISFKNQHVKQDHALELVCKICDSRRPSSTSTEKSFRTNLA